MAPGTRSPPQSQLHESTPNLRSILPVLLMLRESPSNVHCRQRSQEELWSSVASFASPPPLLVFFFSVVRDKRKTHHGVFERYGCFSRILFAVICIYLLHLRHLSKTPRSDPQLLRLRCMRSLIRRTVYHIERRSCSTFLVECPSTQQIRTSVEISVANALTAVYLYRGHVTTNHDQRP